MPEIDKELELIIKRYNEAINELIRLEKSVQKHQDLTDKAKREYDYWDNQLKLECNIRDRIKQTALAEQYNIKLHVTKAPKDLSGIQLPQEKQELLLDRQL